MKELEKKLAVINEACEDKKGIDIKVLNVGEFTSIAEYFVIVTGSSSNQVMAIADEVDYKMSDIGYSEVIKEGYQSGRWILLDYGDIIVHVFHKEERDIYNLERLWSDSKEREAGIQE